MSIWDIRFGPAKLSFTEALKVLALDEWKTIKGAHVEIGEGGEILHGMGGKFKNINDVPRKTVKQRKGESIEQTHERAREIFAKQDAENQGKQTAEARAEAEENKWYEYKQQLQEKRKGLLDEVERIHDKYGPGYFDVKENAPESEFKRWEGLNKEINTLNEKLYEGTYRYDLMEDTFKTADLPTLTGSEKQIKWAKDIRQKFMDKANKEMKKAHWDSVRYRDFENEENRKNYYAQHLEESSSRYWINNRNMLLYNRID